MCANVKKHDKWFLVVFFLLSTRRLLEFVASVPFHSLLSHSALFVCVFCRGFSFVDLVEGAKDGCPYALKRILCHDREGHREAQTETEMHQMFNHPNILTLVAHTFVDRGGKTEAWLLLPYMSVSISISLSVSFRSVVSDR